MRSRAKIILLSLVFTGLSLLCFGGGSGAALLPDVAAFAPAVSTAWTAKGEMTYNPGGAHRRDFFSGEQPYFKKLFKYKKKRYKRALPSSGSLRPAVRETAPVPVNIYLKETYTQPYFLSHLHRFLFRLTPF